jgi:4-diphosphocytidyl-2-C-methyl-D-erythritol kinase
MPSWPKRAHPRSPPWRMATEFAPAKINLALHVTGRRADGYHLLDSLVVFADVGDRLDAAPSDALTLAITGPQAAHLPASDDNLILRAARVMGPLGAAITLEKVLPVASGIGGGSADAAATLRLLSRVWGVPLPGPAAVLKLGADVPVCLSGRPARMTGIGDTVKTLPNALPPAWLVLANPGVAVPTPDVFRALKRAENPPMRDMPRLKTAAELAAFVAMQRNDLEAPAQKMAPVIGQVKSAISAQTGCLLARMSGSGATCFGLFADPLSASAAARRLKALHPGWWVADAAVLS